VLSAPYPTPKMEDPNGAGQRSKEAVQCEAVTSKIPPGETAQLL